MVNVPSAYDPLVREASQGTGIPYNVVAAQANAESGFSATAHSSAGALGWLQFLPSTYDSVASEAGVQPGSETDPASETKAYIVYMKQLLKEEGGSIFKALEAYNAGPGNLQAGAGYATGIMAAAGTSTGAKAGTGTDTSGNAQTTGLLSPIGDIFTKPFETVLSWLGGGILKAIGVPSLKDMLERLGLIALGFALVLVGIHLLSGGSTSYQSNTSTNADTGESTTTRNVNTPVSKHKSTVKSGGKSLAGEAVEAAAVA